MRTQALLLALSLAACGDVTGPGGGGGGDSDGGPDGGGNVDAAVPGTVQVTVLDYDGTREPAADVPVVFVQPDGTVEDTVDTDADGIASAELLPGGAVLAFANIDAPLGVFQPQLWVVVGVEPGDEIVLGGRQTPQPPVETMSFDLPVIKAAVDLYVVQTPCGHTESATEPLLVSFYPHCDASPSAAVAYALVGSDRYVVTASGFEVENEGEVVVEGPWGLVPSPDVTVENAGDASGMEMEWASALIDGVNINLALSSQGSVVDADQVTLAPPRVTQPDHVELQITYGSEQGGGPTNLGTQLWHIWLPGEGDDDEVVIDADAYRMPWIGLPVLDQANRVFGWAHAGEGEWDATYVSFVWQQVEGKALTASGRVAVVAPPGHHQFVLPPVPEDLEEWLPPVIDQITAQTVLFDSDQLDWDAARQLGVDPMNLFDHASTVSEPAVIRYSTTLPYGGPE